MVGGGPHETRIGFTSELGFAIGAVEDGTLSGRGEVVPELCVPAEGGRVLRPSVLITWADILTGALANEFTLPRVCMTVDLDVRIARPIPRSALVEGVGRIVKTGRTLTVGEATFRVDGAPAAVSHASFVASPRPDDLAVSAVRGQDRLAGRPATPPPAPVRDLLGARVVGPGVVEADRSERILNWADTVQGGALAALAEEAALALPGAGVPAELSIRYLASVRIGPMRATATPFGTWTRIEVLDAGRDAAPGRVAAVATAR